MQFTLWLGLTGVEKEIHTQHHTGRRIERNRLYKRRGNAIPNGTTAQWQVVDATGFTSRPTIIKAATANSAEYTQPTTALCGNSAGDFIYIYYAIIYYTGMHVCLHSHIHTHKTTRPSKTSAPSQPIRAQRDAVQCCHLLGVPKTGSIEIAMEFLLDCNCVHSVAAGLWQLYCIFPLLFTGFCAWCAWCHARALFLIWRRLGFGSARGLAVGFVFGFLLCPNKAMFEETPSLVAGMNI